MGRLTDLANQFIESHKTGVLDGHEVGEIIWQAEGMTIFSDDMGRMWRYVEEFKQAWPVWTSDRVQ